MAVKLVKFRDLALSADFKNSVYEDVWSKKVGPIKASRNGELYVMSPAANVIPWTQLDGYLAEIKSKM